jgi:AcrR family transcriptional regulator
MPARARTIPRKTPVQDRSRDTVEAILAATARVLVKEGYEGASTNRIAVAAGVSIGSLYQYFPSKEALVAALIDRHQQQMQEVLVRELARVQHAPVREATRVLVRALLDAHAVAPKLHRMLAEQVPRAGRLEAFHDFERRAVELVRAKLEERKDELRKKDLALAAHVIVAAVEALTHAAVYQPVLLTDPRWCDEVSDLALRYLCD